MTSKRSSQVTELKLNTTLHRPGIQLVGRLSPNIQIP